MTVAACGISMRLSASQPAAVYAMEQTAHRSSSTRLFGNVIAQPTTCHQQESLVKA
jgi:hypothetical protein